MASSLPAGCKPCNQLDYFKKIIRAYQGRDEDAVKYVKKVKALIDKPLDELELGHVRQVHRKIFHIAKPPVRKSTRAIFSFSLVGFFADS